LISIYYNIRLKEDPRFQISTKAFDFEPVVNGSQSFRWADVNRLKPEDITFPVDRFVLRMLREEE
jgi:hypothetical protein